MTPSDDDIELSASDFREAIDRAGLAPWRAKNIMFPRGACGHTSELLAYYLRQRFGIAPVLVCQDAGGLGGWHGGHAWLEWNGLTIDVTGDQFGWTPVIVTRAPEFHGQGVDQNRGPALADMRWWALECGSLWASIAPFLPIQHSQAQ
ncbi:hypothetical protein GCM10007897_08430 [Sphingobium jiangsuense]|uniref:Uncharacterized protein n=1 Tax=Sphingobium jiangsuense TaxID=870476 RepID=A0A7W6FQS2_9SPHN|nr:hypothetical protein [Sphingobium jiangsuense]MBB3927255.1 hypothetical protein [Sphingobium jiangsuense]GLS99463.1 hypothetical protein GCM10007897_08430 [Sphingobium jiangsuense]